MFALKKFTVTVLFCLASLLAYAQNSDTTIISTFDVKENVVLELDFAHTDLNIINAEDDSLKIETYVKVIKSNTAKPFDEIEINHTKNDNHTHVNASVIFSNDFINYNEFQSICTIAIPQKTNLKINSRFGTINLNACTEKIVANIDYVNFNADSIDATESYEIAANYSTIEIKNCQNKFTLKGTNNSLTAQNINKLITDTEFSYVSIDSCKLLNAKSHMDKYVLQTTDSVYISSNKSAAQIVNINKFIQSEMLYGDLNIQNVNPSFSTINIANEYAKTSLNFDPKCQLSINTNLRYCQLNSEKMIFQEIISPNGTQHSGYYGNIKNPNSTVSIVSSYGDVHISFAQ